MAPETDRLAGDTARASAWTLASRVLGFARLAAVAAVLGPTYLGNTYQSANMLPNLLFELFTGSLLATVLVPPLVRAHRDGIARLAGSFLGLIVCCFTLIAAASMLLAPLATAALSAAVSDDAVAARQQRVGELLLVLVLPQIVLYAVAGVGAAAQNARGRFALAAAAPAVESVGVIAVLALFSVRYGSDLALGTISDGALALLGLGSTAAVGLHAALQWEGARRAGVALIPRGGWRAPEVRATVRRMAPTMGYTALNLARILVAIVVAGAVEGGVVAFTLALAFSYLPVAIGARPVAQTMLPRLTRLWQAGAARELRDVATRGTGRAALIVVPAATAYLVLALPIADAASFGGMATERGTGMLALALAALAPGVIGEAAFVVATQVAYALDDAGLALRAIAARTAISLALMLAALALADGAALIAALGASISAGSLAGSLQLGRGLAARLPAGRETLAPALRRAAAGAICMAGPAAAAGFALQGRIADSAALAVATVVGTGVFVWVQRRCGSPELDELLSGLRHLNPGSAA